MKLGNVATGSDFYNREQELADIWEKLKADHLILSGSRRLGKSSILYKLKQQSDRHGFHAAIVDVQGKDSALGFIESLDQKYPDRSTGSMASSVIGTLNPFKKIKKVEAKVMGQGGGVEFKDDQQKPWQESGDRCLARIVAGKNLVLVDEFSVFLDKLLERALEDGVDFLDWLRAWLNDPDIPCRFIFTGSIGLQTLLESHHLTPQMNHCFDYILGPFKRKHAVEMLRSFAPEDWLLESATANHLCDRVSWLSPFYLNLLLNESIQAARDRVLEEPVPLVAPELTNNNQLAILEGDIDDGYERLLAQRSRFIHWENRLKKQLGTNFRLAERILTLLARSDPGLNQSQLLARLQTKESDPEKRAQLLGKLIFQLTEQGYLSVPDSEGKVRFLSFLLKDYWKRNHA